MVFHKYTWLRGTIESNTKAELISVYALWLELANESIKKSGIIQTKNHLARSNSHMVISSYPNSDSDVDMDTVALLNVDEREEAAEDLCIPSDDVFMAIDDNMNLSNLLSFVSGVEINVSSTTNHNNQDYYLNSSNASSKSSTSRRDDGPMNTAARLSLNYDDDEMDEDIQYYDCETGGIAPTPLGKSASFIFSQVEELNELFVKNNEDRNNKSGIRVSDNSTKDTAITVVETVIVLMQFSYWKVIIISLYYICFSYSYSGPQLLQS
jgi:hypothetical protein